MSWLLESDGFSVEAYSSGIEFVQKHDSRRPGCVLLDLRMPGMTGLDVQQWLACRNSHSPIIFLTGHGSIESCATAMKGGATDFLEKPVDDEKLIKLVRRAFEEVERQLRIDAAHAEIAIRIDRLTPREAEVMQMLSTGMNMKAIAGTLGISIQTVAKHRSKVLEKMGVRNDAELVRLLTPLPPHPRACPEIAAVESQRPLSLDPVCATGTRCTSFRR